MMWISSGETMIFPGWERQPATWPASAMCCALPSCYNSFDVLEDGYGINLRPLSMFAARVYHNDLCERLFPQILDENIYAVDPGLAAKMHKAIASHSVQGGGADYRAPSGVPDG